ncbi:hypothetical protein BGW80DRAFT_1435011 [Lactifluus volemus]|nr:hypothetical protein BGW80DRAFT_1435011 [Lactifluus volemus]
MPSLFSRTRTTSSPLKSHKPQSETADDFGRVPSRGPPRVTATTGPAKKDKNAEKPRTRTLSAAKGEHPVFFERGRAYHPDGSFFPLNLDPPGDAGGAPDSERGPRDREQDYGYLSCHRHVVLGLDEELGTRGLTTPFLFSSLALDVNSSGVRRLVQAFLRTCVSFPAPDADRTWREEARFSAPPELAMCLRWGLSRVLRVSTGNAVRGLISWEMYVGWCEAEVALDYPATHFEALIAPHTPPTLSPLFGPLIFGLGPAALPFHHTYLQYLRATNAMEHVLLAFQRSSGSFGGGPGSAASLGVPTRLKDWIRARQDPTRRGARTVRVVSIRGTSTAASWATRPPNAAIHAPNAFVQSRDWERKRMDLPPNFHPHTGITSSTASSISSSTTVSTLGDSPNDFFGLGKPALDRPQWGEFESMGFGGLDPNEKKLQFDLTESARTVLSSGKTDDMTWTDFSASGFSRNDSPLSATLQFSSPLVNSISSWPEQQADITRKLKKTQKSLPPLVVIEEAFIDVFCDLVYGGGWMDIEREDYDRECNWALIEFKSLPLSRSTVSGGSDPLCPLEYRQQLSAGVPNRRTLASFFSPGKTKQWKQAATLNGRPYVVGHVPRGLNSREVEFEGLLRGNNSSTKMISLDSSAPPLFGASRDSTTVRPSTPAGLPITPKRRFRLPTGLPLAPNSRTSGLIPSEAEDVEFETRLASYSDDELNSIHSSSRKLTKHERRASKDDAWVDILVANSSRRSTNLDPDLRRPSGPRARNVPPRPDPEVASQEVAQVLAGIRGPSPAIPLDGESEADIEPMQVPHRSMINSHGASLEEAYIPPPRPPRRVGYFDMHPERRLAVLDPDEDPRDQILRSLEESEGGLPRRSDVTEAPQTPTPAPMPSPRDLQRQQEVRDRLSGKPGPKASSLIEMYREKERLASTSAGGSPGKSTTTQAAKESAPLPPPPPPSPPPIDASSPTLDPAMSTEPSPSPLSLPDTPMSEMDAMAGAGFIEPPNFEFEQGRESPYRYVHGAPLHNVVEEEEEW